MLRISVVIITHNRIAELQNCIQNIMQQAPPPHEIIVVDNASADDTRAVLAREFPAVRVIHSNTNLGIPAGRNLGYREAAGDICVTIDDDATFKSTDAFERVARYFEADDKLCCISFRVEDGDTNLISHKFIPRRDRKTLAHDALGASFVGTGHAMHRARFLALGGFWEALGMYFGEEPDLSYRIMEAGYHILHTVSITVRHYESRIARPAGRRIYHGTRNTPWIALKNLPWYSFVTLTVLAWGYYFVQALRYGLLGSYVKGICDSIRGMKTVAGQRRRVSGSTIRLLKAYSGVYWR